MGSSKDAVVVGYKYYMGLHFGICLSPDGSPVDSIIRIDAGERVAWSGNITSDQQIYINSPELFGGEEEEGGVQGYLDINFGGASQGINSYLSGLLGTVPAFRGILSMVFRRGYITAFNPYVKPWRILAKRCPKYWYSAKAEINSIANPAHIIHECITSREFGMGYPESSIDDASFKAVADTLHSEGFGLSFLYKGNSGSDLEGFIKEVLDHINGTFYQNQSTGLFALKLLRDDYASDDLDLFNEDNILSLDRFERVAWGETTNEITVIYTDPVTFKDTSITVQDLANILIQGGIVSQTKNYRGIRSQSIAYRVAMRDLTVMSTPLAKVNLTINREGWDKIVGDVFKLNWVKLGVENRIYRILDIDYGLLNDGKIKIIASEDVFGLPADTYAEDQDNLWTEPDSTPADLQEWRLDESTYYQVAAKLTQAEIDALDPQFGFITALAKKDNSMFLNYQIHSSSDNVDYKRTGTGFFNPVVKLLNNIDYLDTLIEYSAETDSVFIIENTLIYAGDELMEVTAIDTAAQTFTVKRGVLDTVPTKHTADDIFYFNLPGNDNTERVDGELTHIKLLPKSSSGLLDIGSAIRKTITMNQRYQRPYPPGNVKINDYYYPNNYTGDIVLSWAHRDREQQMAGYNEWTTGDIGPEIGVTYTIKIYNDSSTLIHTETGLSANNFTYTEANEVADNGGSVSPQLDFEIFTVLGSLDCLFKYTHTSSRV